MTKLETGSHEVGSLGTNKFRFPSLGVRNLYPLVIYAVNSQEHELLAE